MYFIILFIIVLFVIVVEAIVGVVESAEFKGKSGENFVSKKIISVLGKEKYVLLNDILLPSNNNIGMTQIDHIIVSYFGIFCIETKAYNGYIFGRAIDENWTQTFYNRKTRFYNPLKQNYCHIKAIEELLKPLNFNIQIRSFIIFPNAKKLNIIGTDSVGYAKDIIKKIEFFNRQVFSYEDIKKIVELIINTNIIDKEKREEHLNKVIKKNHNKNFTVITKYKKNKRKFVDEINSDFDDDIF